MKFEIFKKQVEKPRDAWTEVLITDIITTPLSYLVYKNFTSPMLPYVFTIISFLMRISAAYTFYMANIITGGVLFFLSILTDGLDGKLSRIIFGKDPKLRGLLDFLLDQIGLGFTLICLFLYFIRSYASLHALAIFVLTISLYVQQACTSSLFRLRSELGITKPLSVSFSNNILVKYYVSIQKLFDRYRLMIHPTSVDAEFIVFVVGPFLKFPIILLWLALSFVLIDTIILGCAPALLLGKCEVK